MDIGHGSRLSSCGRRQDAVTELEVLQIEQDEGVCHHFGRESAAALERTARQLSAEGAYKTLLLRGKEMRKHDLEQFCTVGFV